MRDVVWTIIAIWLVYKLVNLFKSAGVTRSGHQTTGPERPRGPQQSDLRNAVRKHVNGAGEYVDYEEIK